MYVHLIDVIQPVCEKVKGIYIPEPDDMAISIERQEQSTTLFVPAIAFWDT